MANPVSITSDRHVGIIELARPEKFNCLSSQAWAAIDEARGQFEANSEIRAVLVCAQGANFCTGADLDEVKAVCKDEAALKAFIERGHAALQAIERSPLPFVAAVQGLCLAGGLELMLGMDVVIAAESARMGDQHAQYGLVPGWGSSQRLPRIIGTRRALDLLFSARWLTAEDAKSIGLVNAIAADDRVREEALAYAMKLGERSRVGLAEMKRLVREGMALSPADAIRFEAGVATGHLTGPDAREGLAAFGERRKPKFD
ncbi:MAG: enoyl-CoA hydratase/isomerase family protein [Hyphomicrobiaceae bacterium]|nr:enoyl-CoA hydratase/isomerase family protein [Hyphomicrobiaceae bacterium]